MKKIGFISALVVAMTAVSCVEDINTVQPQNGSKTFEATFDATASKAVLKPGADESKVEWNKGDKVSVLVGEGKYMYEAQSDGLTTTLATSATDVPSEGTFYGLYPYDENAVLASGVVTTSLPASQTAVLGSFSTHLAVAQSTSGAMAFKNVCGLVKVNVSSDNVTSIVFEGNSGEVVAGAINVTVADAPAWAVVEGQGATSVTLLPAEGQATIAAGDYYFAVLPQTFAAGFKVTSNKNDGYSVVRNVETEVVVERSGMVAGKSFGISGKGTEAEPYVIMTPQDMVDMRSLAKLGGETWFKLGADIDMKGVTNYVPVNYNDKFERKIHFDGADHTVNNFTTDFGTYASLFGVLYGSCKNLKVTNPVINGSTVCGVIGGYVGTTGLPGVVENVTITGAIVTSTSERAGGVCGNAKEATFKNVSFQGSVTTTYTAKEAKSGGFTGQSESTSSYTDCSVDVLLKGSSNDLGGFAGKVTGEATFTGCDVKVVLESMAKEKNRAGGFIGWNSSTKTTITDCHVLEGSTITEASGRTASANGNLAGFIGYADNTSTVLVIENSSASAIVDAGAYSTQTSGFIGALGYASTTTIKNSFASGEVKSAQNYSGGLVGYVSANPNVTIVGCHYSGNVSGSSAVSGLVGGVEGGTVNISKSYATGTLTPKAHNCGGVVGLVNGIVTVENCWTNLVINQSGGQFGAGILGGVQNSAIVRNCYTLGEMNVSRGAGGIVGQIKNKTPEVTGCIAWCSITTKRSATQYSPGAIVGNIQIDGKYMNCFRKADMQFTDVAMTLVDHDDYENGRPPLPDYGDVTADKNQYAYHGKAAAADATVSSIAKSIGWDETIWDLSGSLPVLK